MGLKLNLKYWLRQFPFIYSPRLIYSCEEWIVKQRRTKGLYPGQRGPWYNIIFPESFISNARPKTLGATYDKAFSNNRSYFTGKATLFYLQNCYVFGHKGFVLTANHDVFQEFSHHFNISSLKIFFRKNPFYLFTKNAEKVKGSGAVLVSPESHNYYHWLNDVLPRIKLYEKVLDQIDHFCIASNVPAKILEILTDFGIPKDKILLIKDKEKLHFDYLYVASLPGSEGRSPQWAIDYIREKLVKPSDSFQPLKKFYFKRGDSVERRVLNENIIISILQNNGFEIVDPGVLSIYEQIHLMQQAHTVAGVHGAALSNLLFSRDDTTVIELFSPDYFRTDCYYTLSAIRKLNYWYIVGDKPKMTNWGDIVVNAELLLNTIEAANG